MLLELWVGETEDDTEDGLDELDKRLELLEDERLEEVENEKLEELEDERLALELPTTDCEFELRSVDNPPVDNVADPKRFVCEAEVVRDSEAD